MRIFGACFCLAVALFATALPARSAPTGAASKTDLANLYQRYFNAGDVGRLQSLVYWPGVAKRERDTFIRSAQSDLRLRLKNVVYDVIDNGEMLEYTMGGAVYRPTLSPVARLVATYEGGGTTKASTSYLVGMKGNRYYITLASRVAR
jgi:hypothetical protein